MATVEEREASTETQGRSFSLGPVRVTWSGERPVATWTEDLVALAIGLVGIVGLFWDSWRHNTQVIESDNFWSAPHVLLYAALTGLALWYTIVALRRQRLPEINLAAVPRGYLLGFAGLAIAGLGGPGDFIWHEAYGFEDQVNAFWSPPHQILFYGGTLAIAAVFCSIWAKGPRKLSVPAAVPAVLSLALVLLVGSYALHHLSPLFVSVAPTDAFQENLAGLDDSYPSGDARPGQEGLVDELRDLDDASFPFYYYSLNQAVGGMLLITALLTGGILLLVRRWDPPPGAIGLLLGFYALIYGITTELADIELVAGMVVAGLAIDALIAFLRPDPAARVLPFRALAGLIPVCVLGAYFLAVELLGAGLEWGVSVWLGVIITSVVAGLALSVLMAPPAAPGGVAAREP